MAPSERQAGEGESGCDNRPTSVVVVGVDGSPDSSAALAWATSEARLRHADLRIIHTWSVPALSYGTYIPATAFDDAARAAERALATQVAEVLGDDPAIGYVTEVSEGPPVPALLAAAETALLVVVGSRGRGGFAGLLLGSVSAQVAHHARCPVLIVRSPRP